MLYVIKHSNGSYFHNKGRIILYESQEQAQIYLQEFMQYAVQRVAQEQGGHSAMAVPMTVMSNSHIMQVDFDINNVECGTVYMADLET